VLLRSAAARAENHAGQTPLAAAGAALAVHTHGHTRPRTPYLGHGNVLGVLDEELCLVGVRDAADDDAAPAPVQQVAALRSRQRVWARARACGA